MSNKKRWLGDKGFSLVEIMVAVGMVGGLALVVMTLKKDTATSTKRLEIASEIVSIHNAIGQILLDETACTNTLQNIDVTNPTAVPDIKSASGATMYALATPYGNGTVEIDRIQAQVISSTKQAITSEPGFSRGNVRLSVRYERISNLLPPGGSRLLEREIILSAKMATATDVVSTCYSNEGDAIQEAARIACEAIEGTYDGPNEKCDLKNYGTAPSVSDPTGNSMGISFQWMEGFRLIPGTLTMGNDAGNDAGTLGDMLNLSSRLSVVGVASFTRNINAGANINVAAARQVNLAAGSVINFASDRKLKKNIIEIPNVLDKIDQISGVEFDWKNGNRHDVGFIAQDIQKVFPSLVTKADGHDHLFVRYPQMSAVAIQGVKELRQENILLRRENEKLNADLYKVQSEVEGISYYLCHELKQEKFCH